jgi:hypothetical protein
MAKDQQKDRRPRSKLWLDALLALLLLAAGLGVRWLYVRAVPFPPLDDPAFYLTTAENLVNGRGLEVDALWNYQVSFPSVTHPSHEHWMPLTTGLIAAAFALLKPSLQAGQLPGLILGALLVPLTYIAGRRALPGGDRNRWVSLAAAILVAANAALGYQSASADSSAPYALLGAWALILAIRKPGDEGSYFGLGLIIALAYLTRADGLLLAVAVPLAWFLLPTPAQPVTALPDSPAAQFVWEHWPREEGSDEAWRRTLGPSLRDVLDMMVGFALLVVPWLGRNVLAFGTPLPSSVLSQAWLTDYADTFNYLAHPTWQTLLEQGWPVILAQRGEALLHNAGIFLLNTFPWGLLAIPGLWFLRREWAFFPATIYGLLLFLVTAIVFPVSTVSGTFYHSLGAVVPFLALAAAYAVQRWIERWSKSRKMTAFIFAAVMAGITVLAAAQVFFSLQTVEARHQDEMAQFEKAADWLSRYAAPGDVVMTTQTYTLHYASGHPTIALPANEPPDATWKAAQRYKARFLVITQIFGQYPQILRDQPDPRFRLVEGSETVELYEILGGQP